MTTRIDAHHHVWDLAVRDQPWMKGDRMASIARSYSIDEFAVEAESCNVTSSVVVQTVADIAETEELLDLAAGCSSVAGVIGWVDVAAADVAEQLDRLLARPSGRWLLGIRSLVEYEPDLAWLARPAVRVGMGEVARRGLVNELLVVPHQMSAVVEAARALTDGRFVLDHLAKPPISTAGWEPWATDLAAIAKCDNVSAKISGLVTEADWSKWTVGDVRRYTDHALSVFGHDRLMFGSDWPVCTLAASYGRIVELVEDFTAECSASEQAAIFGGNAAAVYQLDSSMREAQ